MSGNMLYGTAGTAAFDGWYGSVFSFNVTNTAFKVLHTFTGGGDGEYPESGVVLAGNVLYGTTQNGGQGNAGTIFSVKVDSSGYTNLYSFPAVSGSSQTNSAGEAPFAGLVYSGNTNNSNTFYGEASAGGMKGDGTIFSFSVPLPLPELSISLAGTNVVLSWPTNAVGFMLETSSTMGSKAAWGTVGSVPVEVGNQWVVTNSVSGGNQFFQLISN
jgi:uncharacterized repeat protein (TIGR03803 family)